MRKLLTAVVLITTLALGQYPASAATFKSAKTTVTKVGTRHDPETGWYVYARFFIAGIKAKQDYRCTVTAYDKAKKVIIKWSATGASFDPRPYNEYEAFTNIKPAQVKLVKTATATCAIANSAPKAQMLPPIMIDPMTVSTVKVPLTNVLVFLARAPGENWTAIVDDPMIGTFIPGGNQGTYTTNPAFQPLKVGSTIVRISEKGGETYEISVTVTG